MLQARNRPLGGHALEGYSDPNITNNRYIITLRCLKFCHIVIYIEALFCHSNTTLNITIRFILKCAAESKSKSYNLMLNV
jgi:hypothetical protein